ncbi:MAG TPA: ATP-binding protein [Candidatus Limnocylindrales bacterium]|jgi:adenylylsulfate kinase|nr:ATP-binding protein [Candidatus Limnocylindrales bacterium]
MRSSEESTLVVMSGLPGSGKSTLARALAAEVGGVVLDKDQIRAALFPPDLIEYSQRQDDFCMEVLLQTANYLIHQTTKRWVFVDGRPFTREEQLEHVRRVAEEIDCRMKVILCQCSDEAARSRLQQPHIASNRGWELYHKLKAEFQLIEVPHLPVDTERPMEESVADLLIFLRAPIT